MATLAACQLAATPHAIEKTVGALEEERALQTRLAVWTWPKSCPTLSRNQKREESDCEVAANIDEPGLPIVWEHVKRKIKAGPRRTRTEAFFEWPAEHQGDVGLLLGSSSEALPLRGQQSTPPSPSRQLREIV